MNPLKYLKAVAAIVLAALATAYIALNDGVITPQEWIQVAQAAIGTGIGVYVIPNTVPVPAPKGDHAA